MKIAVYYYTRSGNTKKLAEAVASAVGVTANDTNVPLFEKVDLLFLGSSPYGFDADPAAKDFIERNAGKIGIIVIFGSSASGMSTLKALKPIAEKAGIAVYDDDFNCPGHFLFLHKNRPNEADLAAVASFATVVCAKIENAHGTI